MTIGVVSFADRRDAIYRPVTPVIVLVIGAVHDKTEPRQPSADTASALTVTLVFVVAVADPRVRGLIVSVAERADIVTGSVESHFAPSTMARAARASALIPLIRQSNA